MTVVDEQGCLDSEQKAKEKQVFGDKWVFHYVDILGESKSVQGFLKEVYKNHKDQYEIDKYISENIKSGASEFRLIYYEVRPSAKTSQEKESASFPKPSKTWKDRTWLHRCIVDHTTDS